MSSEEVLAAEQPEEDGRRGVGAALRRHPAWLGLILVLFCAVMLAYEIFAPAFFTSRLDDYAELIPRFSDFAIMIDVEALEASPAYDDLDDSVRRQLQLYPDLLAGDGIEIGEGNRLRRILIAGKSQSRRALISFMFDKPVTFGDAVFSRLHRQDYRGYDVWVRRPPDMPIWYFADGASGLLMVSADKTMVSNAIDRRETAAGFRFYKEVAKWMSLLDGDEPIWCAFSALRAYRGDDGDDSGRTFSGLVAAPQRRVPIEGGAARITLDDGLTVRETLVFKTETQAREYVAGRQAQASELSDGERAASQNMGDRMLAVQKIEQDGTTVTIEQSLPLEALGELLHGWPASESMYRLYMR